jgi:hypothetical protein
VADDILTVLRSLANRWTMKARDYARASKEPGTGEGQANYDRGFAEGYYKAATELAAVIKELQEAQEKQAAAPPSASSTHAPIPQRTPQPTAKPVAPKPPAEPAVSYLAITVGEALSVLEFAGTNTRDITQNKDNSFRAVFSRWENMQPHERIERIASRRRITGWSSSRAENSNHMITFWNSPLRTRHDRSAND